MTPDLAAFSDWALAFLPRLFIYPGGLFLLVALALLRLASGGVRLLSPRVVLRDLAVANTLSLALAWVAVAMLPMPGWPLRFAPDPLVIAPLLALSLLLDITVARGTAPALAGGAITLALLVPHVMSAGNVVVWAVSGLAVVAGVYALRAVHDYGLADQARAVGWVWLWLSGGLVVLPIEERWLGPVALLVVAVALGLVLRAARQGRGAPAAATAIAWSLALPSLLASLLLGP